MRGNKYALILLLSLIVVPVGFAAAANSAPSWGVTVGDEFTFNIVTDTNIDYITPFDENIKITITDLPTLPDTVTTSSILYAAYDVEFVNGTDTYLGYGMINILPVGNWGVFTLLFTEMFADFEEFTFYDSYEGSIIDSISIWGFTQDVTTSVSSTSMVAHYSKADGVMNYMTMRVGSASDDEYLQYTITREGYLGGVLGFDPMIAIIGAVAVIGLIVLIVCITKR